MSKETGYVIDWPPCDLTDFSKLDIRDGAIHFRLYDQAGELQPMVIKDTHQNRLYASWIQIHDRYSSVVA